MEAKPDSSLLLLENIEHPEKMSKLNYATWCLLITQAQDKNYVEHTSDSVINVAVNYFEKKNMPSPKAWSYFYLGRIQSDLGEADKAIKSYLKAKICASSLTDNGLKGRICENIGLLYWNCSMYDRAKDVYNEAYTYYMTDKDTLGVLYVLKKMGNIYEALNESDNAIHIYQDALKISEQMHDENEKASLLKAIGNSYEIKKEHSIALLYLRQSLNCPHNPQTLSSLYFSIASVWVAVSQPDSTFYYLHKAMETDDLFIQCSGNRLLYQAYTQKGELKKAYEANERYLELRDSLETLYEPVEIAKVNALYKKEILEKEKNQILLEKSQQYVILLCILLISYILASFIIYKYYTRQKFQQLKLEESERILKQKEELLQVNRYTIDEQNKSLISLQIQIEEKQKELEDADARIRTVLDDYKNVSADMNKMHKMEIDNLRLLKNAIQEEKEQLKRRQMDLLKSISEQQKSLHWLLKVAERWKDEHICRNKFLNQLKQNEAFSFGNEDWLNFKTNFEKEFPLFIVHMKEEFPDMSDSELCFCCLVKMGLKVSQIATIMGINSNTISKRKNEISTFYFQIPGAKLSEKLLLYW